MTDECKDRYVEAAWEFLERAWDRLSDGAYERAAIEAEDASNTLKELASVLETRAARERLKAKASS